MFTDDPFCPTANPETICSFDAADRRLTRILQSGPQVPIWEIESDYPQITQQSLQIRRHSIGCETGKPGNSLSMLIGCYKRAFPDDFSAFSDSYANPRKCAVLTQEMPILPHNSIKLARKAWFSCVEHPFAICPRNRAFWTDFIRGWTAAPNRAQNGYFQLPGGIQLCAPITSKRRLDAERKVYIR